MLWTELEVGGWEEGEIKKTKTTNVQDFFCKRGGATVFTISLTIADLAILLVAILATVEDLPRSCEFHHFVDDDDDDGACVPRI